MCLLTLTNEQQAGLQKALADVSEFFSWVSSPEKTQETISNAQALVDYLCKDCLPLQNVIYNAAEMLKILQSINDLKLN